MGKHKQRHQSQHFNDTSDIFDPIFLEIWCGNNDAPEHRKHWHSRKKSYFGIAKGILDDTGRNSWGLTYNYKVLNREPPKPPKPNRDGFTQYFDPVEQAEKADYANVPKDVPENPYSFMWKCPRCNRVYQLNWNILKPYLEHLINIGQSKVSAAHLEAVQAEILHAKQVEATDNNRP